MHCNVVAVTGITKATQVEKIVLFSEKTGFPVVNALYDTTRHTGQIHPALSWHRDSFRLKVHPRPLMKNIMKRN
jgi:hypothetical protein